MTVAYSYNCNEPVRDSALEDKAFNTFMDARDSLFLLAKNALPDMDEETLAFRLGNEHEAVFNKRFMMFTELRIMSALNGETLPSPYILLLSGSGYYVN